MRISIKNRKKVFILCVVIAGLASVFSVVAGGIILYLAATVTQV